MSIDKDRVIPLDRLDDYKVAEGDPDVRGWDVVGSDGQKVGEVDQLLVDTEALKVRYLDVDLSGEGVEASRHVLVPIGQARLDPDHDRVLVDTLRAAELLALPAYTHGSVTREYETDLRRRFDVSYGAGAGASEAFYAHDLYEDGRFYRDRGAGDETRVTRSEEELTVGRRSVEAGEVEVRKTVETEHVAQPVELRHEEVTVERRPVADPMNTSMEPRIEGDEIHIPIRSEEVVVEKRVVPKEEVLVRTREVTETETVEADVRRERIDVERHGTTPGGDPRS